MRRTLAETVYLQPGNMAISAIGGIVASGVGAWLSRDPAIGRTAALVSIVAVARLIAAVCVPRLRGAGQAAARAVFDWGALVYAATVGLQATLSITHGHGSETQLVLVGFAIAYGAGIAARNAGNPPLAIGQLFLSLAIPICALLALGTEAGTLLAITLAILFPAMASVTLHVHRVLRQSVSAADTSARLAEKMKAIARSDVLTGLNNRAGLNAELAVRLAGPVPAEGLALLWIDLDQFKEVNDLLGHQTGDRLLGEVAARLRRVAPEDAILARFGGDEFIVVCAVRNRREAERLALATLDEIGSPMRFDGHGLEISGSIGIALMPEDGSDADSLMQAADLALFASKAAGKGRVSFFEPGMTRALARRREIEAELRLALQRDELAIAYQPIADLRTGRIRSFEALARWFHPTMGELSPDEFVRVAEGSGAIVALGEWLLGRAARAAAGWPAEVTLAVNLSPLQIKAPGAAQAVLAALRDSGLPPERLELEITENALLEPSPQTDQFIGDLHRAGVRFALDDFGIGYSSLASLNAYPFSRIKIDRSFVSGISAGRKSEAIIRAVSGMAETLGLEIVAEGIETEEQADWVRRAGCTLGQGWHISRAVPDYLAAMLLERERTASLASWPKAVA